MSKVDFNKEIIDEIKNFISANNNKKLKETLKDIHYADFEEVKEEKKEEDKEKSA